MFSNLTRCVLNRSISWPKVCFQSALWKENLIVTTRTCTLLLLTCDVDLIRAGTIDTWISILKKARTTTTTCATTLLVPRPAGDSSRWLLQSTLTPPSATVSLSCVTSSYSGSPQPNSPTIKLLIINWGNCFKLCKQKWCLLLLLLL